MSVETCLLKHLGAKSPINAYRADMAADVQELVADGMTSEAAWIQVVDAKLTDLKAERTRIEQVVADAYAKTAAGKPAATDDVPAPSAAPQEAADEDMRGYAWALVKDGKVVRSGSLPSPEFSPASDDTKLSYYKAMADKTGADLHIGGYPGAAAWAPQEGLIFGMTWDELSARQQKGGRAVSAPEGKMPKDAVLAYSPAVPAAVATHKDPGEPAEVVTPAVVADAIKTAAANTDRTRGEMKAEALRLIDAAIAKAPSTSEIDGNIIIRDPITDRGRKVINAVRKFGGDDDTIQVKATSGSDGKWEVVDDSYDGSGTGRKRNTRLGGLVGTPAIARSQLMDLMRQLQPDGTLSEIDTVTIKVPGDGTFTVKNTVERLKEFRKQVEASPGFKDRQVRPAVEDAGDGAQRGSGGPKSAIQNMIDDGDAQAAVDFAAARGVNIREVLSGDKVRLPKIAGLTPTTDQVGEFEPEAEAPAPIWEANPLSMGREQYVAARVESAGNVNADPEHGVMRNYYGAKKGHQWERGFKAKVEQTHFDAATKAAELGAEVIDAVKYDYPSLFIRSDLSDAQADEAADAMTTVYRDTNDYGKAVQAYREFGGAKTATAVAPAQSAAEAARRNEFMDQQRAYWDGTAIPAIRDYLRAFDAFGADRLERNKIKPEGVSAREWLESFVARQPTLDKGRKVGQTGIQYLSIKDLWPTGDGVGERLRKAALEAVKALKNAPSSTGELMAEAFMERKPSPPAQAQAAPAKPNTEDAGEELTANRRNRIKTGIKWSDIADKNDALKVKEAVKQNVYPRPDYEALVDGGMQPLVAHLVKQVYDSIAAKPAGRGIPTDADLQTYIAGINRVMAGALAWANDSAAVAAWARRETRGAGAMLGQATNLSDLAGRTDAKSMLEYVAPNGWREHIAEFRIVGSNKVLGALQPGYDESTRAIKALNAGWPASQEAWQKRGLKVAHADKIDVTYYESKATSRAGVYVSINFKVGKHDYKQESIDGVDTREAPEVKAAVAAEIADTQGKWLILSKYGRLVSKHDTEEAATEAAREIVKRGGKEAGPDDSGIDVSMATREGPAHRMEGQNVSSDQVKDAFGFKGVNFGTWMKGDSPALVAERQAHLNHAYDSFMDLADLFGVPPKAMSLNGMLGLAIGAQGTGGSRAAAAHFVPGLNEINLTRASGAGSLAHEWGHALDHYFATQAGLAKAGEPFLTEHTTRPVGGTLRPEIMAAFRSIVTAMNKKPESALQLGVRVAAEKSRALRNVEGWLRSIRRDFVAAKVDEAEVDRIAKRITDLDLGDGKVMAGPATAISPAVDDLRTLYQKATGKRYSIDQIKGLSQNVDHLAYISKTREHVPQVAATEYAENARKMDKDKGGKPYWGTNLEKFARAFDAFVSDTLADKAAKNSYLSHTGRMGETVPMGDERTAINAAIKTLVDTVQTRADDAGNVEMFSLADEAGSDIAAAWKTLAENDDLFAFPKSDAADLAEIASEAAPNLSVEPATGRLPDDVQAAWHVYPPNKPKTQDNRGYVIHYKDGKVEVNVAKFQQGDAGSQVYAVAGNYAFNNGLEFAGDRLGITDVAVQRRLENMISLALKFGTTDFMSPHPDMLKTLGLKWTQGDSNANLQNMLLASYENAISKYPALKDVVYDPSTGKLQSQSRGVALTDAEAARLVAGARVRGLPIGRRTLSRLSVTQAVAESQAGPERGQLLALIGERARGPVESLGVLSGVAYSPSDGVANDYVPADTAAYEPAGNADTEAVERLAASLNAGQPRSRHVVLDAVAPRAGGTGARARELAAVATTAKRLFGRRIVFVRFQGAPLFNGVVSTKHPGVIFLNADSKKPMMAVLGHELLHELRKSMPGVYKELQARLDAMMRDQPSYFARIEQAYTAAGRAVPKDWMEELHADVVGDFFTDAQFWQDMAAEQPGLFKRVAGAILKFLDNVAEQLAGVRTFGTDRYLRDVAAARAAVADAMRQFSGTEVGAMTGQAEGISLSMDGGQTEAAAFKRWFGESKVVDAAGKPLVVYHGTARDFNVFDGSAESVHIPLPGFFFSPSTDIASGFAESAGKLGEYKAGRPFQPIGANVMPVMLSIKNPVEIDASNAANGGKMPSEKAIKAMLVEAKSRGHDGAVINGWADGSGPVQYVAFRPEQIKSAIGNRGTFDGTDPDIRLSIAGSVAESNGDYASQVRTAQDLIDARGSGVFDFNRIGATKQDRIRTVVDGSRPFWLGALTRDQIADIYGSEIQSVKEYDALTRAMENERSKMAGDADTLYGEWAKIDQKDNDRLARIMLDATVHQVHPDGPFVPGGENDTERKRVHGMISTQFRLLPPEAKAMYGKVKGFHLDTLTKLRDALMARIERQVDGGQARAAALTNIRQMFDKYLGSGPYFPLSRFGDYLVVATREEDGERVVASYETAGEQQAAARKLESDGFRVKMKTAKTYSRETDGAAGKFIGDVLTLVDGLDMDDASVGGRAADLKKKLLDDINQLFIKALPDLSYRKHFMHRKGTAGFSSDVMRGFASSAFHAASHIARLNHGDKMTFALQDAFSAIENAPAGDFNQHSQVLNELTKRHDAALNPNTHPIAAMLNQVGFVMYLGLSPAAGIVNMLQTVMVTMPHLGARYGFTKANTSLAAAYKDILAAPMNAKNGWNAAQSNKLTAAERAVMTELQDEGVIDLTQAHDLASATGLDTGNVTRSKAAFAMSRAMKIVGWTFHIPEVMNRQVTALSAYRLEMEKSGNVEAAKDAAREAIKRTHFDYSGSNRARFMQSNLARVMLQFKQYSQNMTYLLGRAAFQALKGESPEVRAIARKQLVATLGVTFGMAGALGLPGIGGVMGLIGAFVQGLDDDDKPWDWKVEFRNLLADTVGQEAGEVIAHGIPRAIPRALMPWDISSRVGMGDMWFRSNDREGQNPREAWANDMQNILGPSAGTLLGMYTAADHMARGNWSKGVESMVPKFLRDLLKAMREGNEGMTNYNGEPLLDVGGLEVMGRAIGFAPARGSEMFEARNAVKNAETAINMKRQRLLSTMVKARLDLDSAAIMEIQADIMDFNRRNPAFRITSESIVKSTQAKRRNMAATKAGIRLPKGKDELRELGRFAEVE